MSGQFLSPVPCQGLVEFTGQLVRVLDQGGDNALGMTSTLSAILSALELGHLDHTGDLRTLEAPPPAEAMEQTVSAVWSDLFALFPFSALERDIEDLGWGLRPPTPPACIASVWASGAFVPPSSRGG